MASPTFVFCFFALLACLSAEGADMSGFIRTVADLQESVGLARDRLASLGGRDDQSCRTSECRDALLYALIDPFLYLGEPVLFAAGAASKFAAAAAELAKCTAEHVTLVKQCGQEFVESVKQEVAYAETFFPEYGKYLHKYNKNITYALSECLHKTASCEDTHPGYPPFY